MTTRIPANTVLMLALTMTTGIVDAVGYLGLDRVFTANMTGNVVLLGMGLTGAADLPVLRPVLVLIAFAAGAVVAGRVLRRQEPGWSNRVTVLLGVVAAGVAGAAVEMAVFGARPADPTGAIITTTIAVFMGIQAGTARRIAVPDVPTVVVTSTLVGLAFDSPLAGGDNRGWARRLPAIACILIGAISGAALLQLNLALPLLLAFAGILVVTVVGHSRWRGRVSEPA